MWLAELNVAADAARQAGELLRSMQDGITVREKGPADLVTEADLASQQLIMQRIRDHWPDDAVLGEEDPQRAEVLNRLPELERCWIVDPLDGTTNFVHGLDNYGVSIALAVRGEVCVGVVYDPVRDELFQARRGGGAQLNAAPLQVSSAQRLDQALVAASLPARVHRDSAEVHRFLEVLFQAQAVRRLGSAALNLCYVGRGSIDAYWATSVQAWDVAAGLLVVTEAGGVTSRIDGRIIDLRIGDILAASTPPLQREIVAVLEAVPGPAR